MSEKTERLTCLKFELTGGLTHQLASVEHGIYNFGVKNPASPTKVVVQDSSIWQTTDDILYKNAKQSYDNIINTFTKQPRVYKLASIKERIWKENDDNFARLSSSVGNVVAPPSIQTTKSDKRTSPSKKKKKLKKPDELTSDVESIDEESSLGKDILDTVINPFQVGSVGEVWKEKLDILEKLTPREDMEGFEYRENYNEQQYRFSLQNFYAEKMKEEIYRRQQNPTDIEQVEDAIFDVIEKVVTKVEQDAVETVANRVKIFLDQRHPSTMGCKLKRLPAIENEEGEISYILSDLEHADLTITPAGLGVATHIPNKTLLLHEQEREFEHRLKVREMEDKESLRRMPLTHKLRSAIARAKVDKNEALREVLRGIVDSALVLPSRPLRNAFASYLKMGQNMLERITTDHRESFQEFLFQINDKVENLKQAHNAANYKPNISSAKSLVEEAKKLLREKEEQSNLPSDSNFEPSLNINTFGTSPVSLPDAVMVTLKIHYNIPPAYVIRHRRTINLEWEKLSKRARKLAVKYHLIDDVKKISKENATKKNDAKVTANPHSAGKLTLPDIVNTANKDTISTAVTGGIVDEDEEEDDEAIPVERLVGSRHFSGYLQLNDMITPKVKNEEKLKNNPIIRDSSLRESFESTFLEQIALACGIPVENINIEQIRRLEPDNSELLRKIEDKQQILQQKLFLKKEKDAMASVKQLVRKAYSKGIILDEETLLLAELQHLQSSSVVNDDTSTMLAGLLLFDDNESITTVGEKELDDRVRNEVATVLRDVVDTVVAENSKEVRVQCSGEEDCRPVVLSVIQEIVTIIEKTAELAHVLDYSLFSNMDISVQDTLSIPTMDGQEMLPIPEIDDQDFATNEDDKTLNYSVSIESGITGLQSRKFSISKEHDGSSFISNSTPVTEYLSSSFNTMNAGSIHFNPMSIMRKSQPIIPQPFEIGIANPSQLLQDEDYWLSRTLRSRNLDEKRRYRFQKLAKLRNYYYKNKNGKLYAFIQDLTAEAILSKADLAEDITDYLEPLIKYVDSMLDVIRPEMAKFRFQLTIALKLVIVYAFKALKEAKSRQQGLKRFIPALSELLGTNPTDVQKLVGEMENNVPIVRKDSKDNIDVEIILCMNDILAMIEKNFAKSSEGHNNQEKVDAGIIDTNAQKIDETILVSSKSEASNSNYITSTIDIEKNEKERNEKENESAIIADSNEKYDNDEDREENDGEPEQDENDEEDEEINNIEENESLPNVDKNSEISDSNNNKVLGTTAQPHLDQSSNSKSPREEEKQANITDDKEEEESDEESNDADEEEDHDEEDKSNESDTSSSIGEKNAENPDTSTSSELPSNSSPKSSSHLGSNHNNSRYHVKNILHPSRYSPAQRIALVAGIFEKEGLTALEGTIADDSTSNEVDWMDCHISAINRVRKLKAYDDEIVDSMEALLAQVEDLALQPSVSYERNSISVISIDDKRWKTMTFGSEISILIRIKPEQRQVVEGLTDLCSQDIAHYLRQQCEDPFSVLNQGTITQHIVDVSFKSVYEKVNALSSWHSYWIQRIHPSFFNYTATKRYDLATGKTIKTKKELRFKDEDSSQSALGIVVVNPLEKLDERSKEAMVALNKKPILLAPGERLKRYETQSNMKEQVSSDVIDFDIDEFGKEFQSKGIKLYRPNMETLTEKDVRRCYRVYLACKEAHEKEMSKGLVNNGLLPVQHQAMKDMMTAFRIYRSARQKLQQNIRRRQKLGLEIDEFAPPPLYVTNISQDLFDTWVDEVKEEDRIRLQAKREQKQKLKEALQIEAELRREMDKRKYWVLENFVKYYHEGNPNQLGEAVSAENMSQPNLHGSNTAVSATSLALIRGTGDEKSMNDSLQYSISTAETPASDYRICLPEKAATYYRYFHDSLEFNGAIAKEIDIAERERQVMLTYAPKVDDGVNKLSEEEKKIIALHEAENEKKKVIISEEKRTRRLFSLLVRWEKSRQQILQSTRNTVDGVSQSLSKRLFSSAGNRAEMQDDGSIPNAQLSAQSSITGISRPSTQDRSPGDESFPATNNRSLTAAGDDGDEASKNGSVSKLETLAFLMYALSAMDKGAGEKFGALPLSPSRHARRLKSRNVRNRSKMNSQGQESIVERKETGAENNHPLLTSSSTPALRPILSTSDNGVRENENADVIRVLDDESITSSVSRADIGNNSPSRRSTGAVWTMTDDDWQLVSGIQWIAAVRDQLPLMDCFLHFPTSDIRRITRDELTQWAVIMVHLYPIFSDAVQKLNEAKRKAEEALGVKADKLNRNRARKESIDEWKSEEELKLEQEKQAELQSIAQQKRLEEIRRTAEREKAWFMAHPHKYVHPKGQKDAPTFCLICHAKAHEYWLKCHDDAEVERSANLERTFGDILEEKEDKLLDIIEKEQKMVLEEKAKRIIEDALIKEGVINPVEQAGNEDVSESKPLQTVSVSTSQDEQVDELALWEEKMKHIRSYLHRHNVPLVDARGKALLPKKAPKRLRSISVRPMPPSDIPNGKAQIVHQEEHLGHVDPNDINTVRVNTSCKLRVFHRDHESLEKSVFLGMIEFSSSDLLDPPKGFRTFKLRPDCHLPETECTNTMIGGSIAVMIRLTTQQRKDGGEKCNWRIIVKKLSKLPQVDKQKFTNSYVEVLWRGEAERYQRSALITSYVIVGQTITKFESIAPEFNEREYHDNSLFELPPMWTDLPIPGRGFRESDVCREGGFIPKNWQETIDTYHQSQMDASMKDDAGKSGKIGFHKSSHSSSLDEIRRFRRQRTYKELLAKELKIAVEAERYILHLQEKERLLMAREESVQRCREDAEEQALYAEDLAIQERFALDFQRLLELVVEPSPLLSRLRFLMGEIEIVEEDGDDENAEDDKADQATNGKESRGIDWKQIATTLESSSDKSNSAGSTKRNHSHSDDSQSKRKVTEITSSSSEIVTNTLLASLTASARPFPKAKRTYPDEIDTAPNQSPSKFPSIANTNNNSSNIPPNKESAALSSSSRSMNPVFLSPDKIRGRKIEGSGSMRVICEDPSTRDLLRVVVLPILHAADEASIRQQAMTLAGMRSSALTRILDVAVHDVRSYNAQGFTAMHERHAVVIMEYINGPTLGRYLFDHWNRITNAQLRSWLTQIFEGLAAFHEYGLLHRNLSPKSFIVQIASVQQSGNNNGNKPNRRQQMLSSQRKHVNASSQSQVLVRLQEYWFLENPRSTSQSSGDLALQQASGRGAWGCRQTAPPEVRNPGLYQQQTFQQYQQQLQLEKQQQYLMPTRQSPIPAASSPGKRSASQLPSPAAPSLVKSATQMTYITDKSDMFALGMCVFFWVTKGLSLPMEFFQHGNIDQLERFLPLKWKPWVMILLRMTLSLNPMRRASAKEVVDFLTGDMGNN